MTLPNDFCPPPGATGARCDCWLAVTSADDERGFIGVHLMLDGRWHWVTLDYGLVFWRQGVTPEDFVNTSRTVVDETDRLALRNAILDRVDADEPEGGHGMKARVRFVFRNGVEIVLRSHDGQVTYELS